ncbi:MAG: hypothetical protein EOR63_32130 [Mesorhizobium sp.]|nr:MAG: hypothetical protein EOR63_32130 [Mesorhizobium sp.]
MFVNGYGLPQGLSCFVIEDLLGDGFLVGPVFSIHGRGGDYDHVWGWDDLTPPIWSEGEYSIAGLVDFEPGCVVLFRKDEPVGFYLEGQAWIDPDHRGKGFGPKMVLSAIAHEGRLPEIKDIGFTEGGYRTHAAALRLMQEMQPSPTVNP